MSVVTNLAINITCRNVGARYKLSMMVVNANLTYGGFFARALYLLLRLTRSPLGLLIALTVGTGVLSAFFLNDTLALIFTPFTLSLTTALKLNPIPYLLAVFCSDKYWVCRDSQRQPPKYINWFFFGYRLP
jgi:glucose-6-phosphate-specific signal transduction histidine kinase